MEELIRQIKEQQEINFKNVEAQILCADLETVFDGENNSRYIFHYLHSMDRFFMNPADYVYEGDSLFRINEDLSIIDSNRVGYIEDKSIVISRQQLLDYFNFVKAKIQNYFETLTVEQLMEKPADCEYTRLEFILAQFRHLMWHVGVSSAITFNSKGQWNEFTGLSGLRAMFPLKN
ncbi:MAG: hypothetical protein MJ188_10315 [Treponema sp.]|nr:hypothetical protein [Treponema sp.]